MKKMNKFLSLLLAIVMVLSLAVTGFAADSYKITVDDVKPGYTYGAYQIFSGELSKDGTLNRLSNIEWGTGINNATALITRLNNLTIGEEMPFAECDTAADVAEVLGKNTTKNNEVAKAFAEVVGDYLNITSGTGVYDETAETYTITVDEPGYYMVSSLTIPGDAAATRYILEVVADVHVTHKGDVPTVDKNILGYAVDKDGNPIPAKESEESIGDTIYYEIVGTMPSNIDDYDTYFYRFTDTMSKGLTYNGNLKVMVDGVDLTKYFWVEVNEYPEHAEPHTDLLVIIQDVKALTLLADEEGNKLLPNGITANTKIVVTYECILNENAVIGVEGNENSVNLSYSNNPNQDGEPADNPPPPPTEKPVNKTPIGTTPEAEVFTYVTELTIIKVDGHGNKLTGAAFKIEGDSVKNILATGEIFVEDENGEYYKLVDGTFTKDAPVMGDDPATDEIEQANDHLYVNDSKMYTKNEYTYIDHSVEHVEHTAFVGPDGTLKFTGLGAGTYTITEVVTPEGYNTINPITVTITWNLDQDGKGCIWTYSEEFDYVDNNGNKQYDPETDYYTNTLTVVNQAGATLPSTGGMGTTIFYGLGSVLVLAAVVLLVSKKRMACAE